MMSEETGLSKRTKKCPTCGEKADNGRPSLDKFILQCPNGHTWRVDRAQVKP